MDWLARGKEAVLRPPFWHDESPCDDWGRGGGVGARATALVRRPRKACDDATIDCMAYDPERGEGSMFWKWHACCTDGLVFGPCPPPPRTHAARRGGRLQSRRWKGAWCRTQRSDARRVALRAVRASASKRSHGDRGDENGVLKRDQGARARAVEAFPTPNHASLPSFPDAAELNLPLPQPQSGRGGTKDVSIDPSSSTDINNRTTTTKPVGSRPVPRHGLLPQRGGRA